MRRIAGDRARLDILVNDVWGGDPFVEWGKSLWEHPLDATLGVLRNGSGIVALVDAEALIAACQATPIPELV